MQEPENDKTDKQQASPIDETAILDESPQPESDPEPQVEDNDSGRMSLKDKLSLIIACLALLLSAVSFIYQVKKNRSQDARAQDQENRVLKQEQALREDAALALQRERAHAYNLGRYFTLAYLTTLQFTKGTQKEISDGKESAKRFLAENTRELAFSLGLNPDLSTYLQRQPGDIFGSFTPFTSLERKIASFHSAETVAAFNVGSSLTFLNFQKAGASEFGKLEPFKTTIFPPFRDRLNRNLKVLGVADEALLPEFDNIESVSKRLSDMKKKYDAEIGRIT